MLLHVELMCISEPLHAVIDDLRCLTEAVIEDTGTTATDT